MKKTSDWTTRLAKPAQRALTGAGITSLRQVAKFSEDELSALHGIGPNAVQSIGKSLADIGLSFAKKKK